LHLDTGKVPSMKGYTPFLTFGPNFPLKAAFITTCAQLPSMLVDKKMGTHVSTE